MFGQRYIKRSLLTILSLGMFSPICDLYAQKNTKQKNANQKNSKKSQSLKTATAPSLDRSFDDVKKDFRHADANHAQLWAALQPIDAQIKDLRLENQVSILQLQASILHKSGYPYLSSIYASEAINRAPKPMAPQLAIAWSTLNQSRSRRPMQQMIEDLAASVSEKSKDGPSVFGNSWFYYLANAEQARGNAKLALEYYGRLRINDYHFLSAQYQIAMIHLANNRKSDAESALKSMLNSVSQTLAPLSKDTLKEMSNYAKIALARLYYQDEKFVNAIKFYRSVDRDSQLFYDSLFEQSWAFFMAGYPNHSLGAVYSVESPFFKDVYNPESTLLRAVVNYWMCRYDDSKSALAEFTTKHADAVETLGDYLSRKRLTDESAYQLFENHVSGVSSKSLGMPRSVLESAAVTESMMLLRAQYAGLVGEMDLFEKQGVFGSRQSKRATERLESHLQKFRKKIGGQYIVELQSMQKSFERLYEQSQFLYVELLMSEREQLLGRELHASSKMDVVTRRKNIAGWGDKTQAWGDNRLNEFWWDEVGFYIHDAKPMCKTSN